MPRRQTFHVTARISVTAIISTNNAKKKSKTKQYETIAVDLKGVAQSNAL